MKNIKVETRNFITFITLNRPDVRNAFDDEMIAELTEAFKNIQQDKGARAVMIEGQGKSFCAGGDLKWMKSMVDYSQQENREDSEKLYDMYQAMTEIPVPVTTLVHGHAMGGGLGLIAASDICFAADDTQFCFSEVRLGLAPAVISGFVQKKILPRDLSRYFLTAEVFGPEEAYDMGLIHHFGTKGDMMAMALATTKKVTRNGPQAVRATKTLIGDLSQGINVKQRTTELIADLRVSEEGQEGLKAFFEKRKPGWLGSDK